MAEPFSIDPGSIAGLDDSLREEIQAHTRNPTETSRILSAIRRFGTDPSIERFDLIPTASRTFRGVAGTSWTVRAYREGRDPAPVSGEDAARSDADGSTD